MSDYYTSSFWIELEQDGYIKGLNTTFWYQKGSDGTTSQCTGTTLFAAAHQKVFMGTTKDYLAGDPCISFTVKGKIGGRLSTLGRGGDYGFAGLFKDNTKLVDASELNFSNLEVGEDCFKSMFEGCTSLVNAPQKLGVNTDAYSHDSMFKGCTSLVTAPELPATYLGYRCYDCMFQDCTSLVTAPELPATTLEGYCYSGMFLGCTSLVTAPELPATNLENGCYNGMFQGCTSLVTAPELPATTLEGFCYQYMFLDCTSLVNAPSILPATTLDEYCYYGMFKGCTSLVNAPILPATTLEEYCYNSMFTNCTSLNYIKMLAVDITALSCLGGWVDGVAPTGTFVKAAENTSLKIDNISGIPVGWTVVDEGNDPDIPNIEELKQQYFWVEKIDSNVIISVSGSYEYSFDGESWRTGYSDVNINLIVKDIVFLRSKGDSSGIVKPTFNGKVAIGGPMKSINDDPIKCRELFKDDSYIVDASGLILHDTLIGFFDSSNDYCYENMFNGCVNLVSAPILPATTLEDYCYSGMFWGCTSLVNAPELPAVKLAPSCYKDMFYGCTSLVNAPELPALELKSFCYDNMFNGCTSLVNAPELPATMLASNCYENMFFGCTSLVNAPELNAPILKSNCYYGMFANCTSLTYIKMMAIDISPSSCVRRLNDGGSPTGTLVKTSRINMPIATPENYYNGILSGWTIENVDVPVRNGHIEPQDITVSHKEQTIKIKINQTNIIGWENAYFSSNGTNSTQYLGASIQSIDFYNSTVEIKFYENTDETDRGAIIALRGIDYEGNYVVGLFPFVQKGKIPDPEIRLYKDILEYPSSGGVKYVQVDYFNANNIFIPYCPQNWVTIEKSQQGSYDEGNYKVTQCQYRITMNPTMYDRSVNVVFACSDIYGGIYEDYNLVLHQSAPSDSYVVLSKKEIILKNEGDIDEVQVTYINIADIISPETSDDYEITEVSRSEPNTNSVQVVYSIKKTSSFENTITISFTGTDNSGNIINSENFDIIGWVAPPATLTIPRTDLKNGVLVFDYTGGTKTIRLNIDGYKKPINISHSVTDLNYSVHVLSSEVAYDDGYNYAVWHINIECEGNDSDYAYEGSIDIHYTDEVTDETITIPFHVRYETEGLIEPFGNNLKYDKDGNLLTSNNFVNIGYLNIATINTPTCSDWITVSARQKEEGVFSTYDEVYRYTIAVAPNSGGERNGVITFTGIGVDGKTYSTNITLFQEGDDTEIVIDEGYIELQSLSMVLPSEGGSDTFQVKYYDAAEILEPEFMANWATIEKISESTEQGVAWNGEECLVTTVTYKVTAQKSTSGRQAKVLCKLYINNEDSTIYMEKDKFVVYQLAPDSTEVQGSVEVLRYSKTYTYYGSPIGFDPEVGYKDVAPQLPLIEVDWCRVKNITDSTSKEYDIIKAYDIEMDVNPTQFPRTCVITFIGKGEDGTYVESPITVTQEGQTEDINEGVYSNYKGYFRAMDCTLYSVSFITNPSSDVYGEIMLAGEAPVLVSYTESERIYTPIRTSTCTVRVVSSQYLMNLYSGKAQGTQVILKNEDTGEIEWCGYLQPNLYNQGFSEPIEEIEFEASDCLSGLQYFKYENCYANGRFLVSFKDIVDNIMDRCKLINSYFITQKMYSDGESSRVMKFVNFNISEYNFYSEEDEPWTLQEVVEEICKYLGYVCFQWGDSIYFIDYDMYTVNKTMIGLRWDKETKWLTENMVAISGSNNIITEESYKETGGSMSLDDVFNKVTVNCNYYNIDNLIPDLFDDDLLTNRLGENVITSISRYGGTGNSVLLNKTFYRVYDHKNIDSIFYIPIADISNHETIAAPTEEDFSDKYFFRNYVGGNIVDMVHLTYNEANGEPGESKEFERYLMISQLNRPWCGAEGTFHWENYNLPIMEFKDLPVIHIDNTADEIERVPARSVNRSLSSNRPANPKPAPNYLIINAEAAFVPFLNSEYVSDTIEKGLEKKSGQSYYTYGDYTFDNIRNMPSLCFYLEIPQKGWWDGTEWVDYKTYFEVPLEYFGEDKDDDKWYEDIWATTKNVKNNVETYLFLGTTGYRIPLPKEMDTTRDMYFAIAMPKRFVHLSDIRGGDDTGEVGNAYCFIKNLEMKIVNRNTILYDDDDVIFENIIDEGNVIDGDEISLRITSDNHQKFSLSTVSTRTISDELITDFMFYNKNYELLKPEEAIIEKYVNQYSTPSIKTNITLDMSFKPFQLITDTYWNKDFVITGQEIDYQRGKQTITLLEKK